MGKQQRSENTYQKINTIFRRDTKNCIMPYDGYVMPELEWMKDCKFDATEKIDGTNIRIELTREDKLVSVNTNLLCCNAATSIIWRIDYKGKTDNAQIPPKLLAYLKDKFPLETVCNALGIKPVMNATDTYEPGSTAEKWVNKDGGVSRFNMNIVPERYTIYGEGYGAGIQSGGYYRKDNAFIGFDVKVDDLYLLKPNMEDIFNKMGADIVPYIGQFTILEAIEYVKKGFKSVIAEDEHLAEGLVLKNPYGLMDRRGERIVFKIKTCDWNKYYSTYGTYDKVEQSVNEKANYE